MDISKETLFQKYIEEVSTMDKVAVLMKGGAELVVGNESCDLDSAMSALVHAFCLHTKRDKNTPIIPVLQVTRSDLVIKTEVCYLLNKYNISMDAYLYLDDVTSLPVGEETRLHLVDHNIPTPPFSNFTVQSIIDHHHIDKLRNRSVLEIFLVEMVGSCMTLITDHYKQTILDADDQTLANIILATILLDTVQLTNPHKTTSTDRTTCELITQHFKISTEQCQNLYKSVIHAKQDVSGLTTLQNLNKDQKMVTVGSKTIVLCTVGLPFSELCARCDLETALQTLQERTISISVFIKCGVIIFFYSQHDRLLINRIMSYLRERSELGIQIIPPVSNIPQNTILAKLTKPGVSRKQLQPVIEEYLKEEEAASRLRVDSHTDLTFQLELSGSNTPQYRDSPHQISSHENSGFHTPVSPNHECNTVPPNSYIDTELHLRQTTLPSFNNSEMVKRIISKKQQMGEFAVTVRYSEGDHDDMGVMPLRPDNSSDVEPSSVPFTPVNSFADSYFDGQSMSGANILPTINNRETLEKVLESRNKSSHHSNDPDVEVSLEREPQSLFTPHNSVVGSLVDASEVHGAMSRTQNRYQQSTTLNEVELHRKLSEVEQSTVDDLSAARLTAQKIVESAIQGAIGNINMNDS